MSEVKRYMNEVASLLNCTDKEKAFYLNTIQNSFAEDADQLSYEEITRRLGTPEEWVNAHLEARGGESYRKNVGALKKKANLLRCIVAIIVLVIISLVVYFIVVNERSRGYSSDYGEPSVVQTTIEQKH